MREVGGPVPRSSNAVGARLILTSLTDMVYIFWYCCCCFCCCCVDA